jgi:hypothetical protein
MTPMTEYEAYKMYLALRAHFQTEEYDVIKMRGKIRASHKAFAGSGKAFSFRRLVKLYKDDEICDFMVANFIGGDRWGGVFDVDATRQYQDWKRRVESLSYQFNNELEYLQTQMLDNNVGLLECRDGEHPLIVRAYLGKHISIETLVILDRILNFVAEIDARSPDMFMWPELSLTIRKYRPFLRIELEQYRKIYEQRFN